MKLPETMRTELLKPVKERAWRLPAIANFILGGAGAGLYILDSLRLLFSAESAPQKQLSLFISKTAGERVVAQLKVADEVKQAIIKECQRDPLKGDILHVDFQEILATEEVRVMVHAVIVGEAVGVKRDGGIMQHGIRDVEIECLPDKIPGHIDVDVSNLGVGQSLHVSDLAFEEGIRVLTDPDEVLVTITSVKEEVAAPEAAPEVVEPEVIKKGKKTEEEG